jgi:hypothetical protein
MQMRCAPARLLPAVAFVLAFCTGLAVFLPPMAGQAASNALIDLCADDHAIPRFIRDAEQRDRSCR